MKTLRGLTRGTKLFLALTLAYLVLAFVLPVNAASAATYRLTDTQFSYLLFLLRIPVIAMWLVTYWAYRALHEYGSRIKDTPEGSDFASITRGMFWIAWGLPIPALVGILIGAFVNNHPDARLVSLVVTNYMYVVVALFAFSFVSAGSYRLAERSRIHLSTKHIRWLVLVLVALGVLFCYFIGSRLHGTSLGDSINSYFLPNALVWLTIVIPYLYAWFLGLFAALQIALVARHTMGIIYRQALQTLAIGLVVMIISMCMLQYFRSVIPRTGIFRIGGTLITTYAIYALHVVGAVLIIIGAKRLKKIEDV